MDSDVFAALLINSPRTIERKERARYVLRYKCVSNVTGARRTYSCCAALCLIINEQKVQERLPGQVKAPHNADYRLPFSSATKYIDEKEGKPFGTTPIKKWASLIIKEKFTTKLPISR